MKTTFQLSTLSAAVAATLISGYATAQVNIREEVIVTATRRSESIQDIPINITAIGGDLIARERLDNLSDLAKRVPGMTNVDQGQRATNTTTVRGLNTSSVTATDGINDGGGTVSTYLGDIPLYVDLKLLDMDRVEVLIGPQGTLYGAGTLGGAIRYIPNRPVTDATELELRGDLYDLSESDDVGFDIGATINIPIIEDSLAFRASVDYEDDPGFIDYNYLVREAGVSNPQPDFSDPADVSANLRSQKDANTVETMAARAALRYTGDRADINLTYYYQNRDVGARQINHQQAFGTGFYEAAHRFEEPSEVENQLTALEMVFDLGFAELTSATGYSEFSQDGQRDQTDLLLQFAYGELYGYGYDTFPSFSAFTREKTSEETITQELRLVSTGDGPFSWIVGGFYSDFELDATSEEFAPGYDTYLIDVEGVGVQPRPDDLEYFQITEEEREELAFFGEIGYQVTDAWQVTVGARWFDYEVTNSGGFDLPLLRTTLNGRTPVDLIAPDVSTQEASDDDVILKFNTSYDFNDDVMGYLTISEGYRNGEANAVPLCPDPLEEGQNVCAQSNELFVDSDTTLNYEIGIHSQWENLTLNASVYFIEWEEVRVDSVTENGGLPIFVNGNDATSQGIELSSMFYITPAFSLTGSYSWNQSELSEDTDVAIIDGPFDSEEFSVTNVFGQDGDRLPGSPEHQIYLAANYEHALSGDSTLDFNWNMTAQSDVLTKVGSRAQGAELDGFAVHNVSLSWRAEATVVSLYADNVFDREYVTGVRRDPSYVTSISGFDLRRFYENVGRPRQVGLRVVYNFED